MLATVTFRAAEQADAGLVAAVDIGEVAGVIFAGFGTVGNKIMEQQLALFEIKNPQAFFAGRQGKINHRQSVGTVAAALQAGTLHCIQGMTEHLLVQLGGGFEQTVVQGNVGCGNTKRSVKQSGQRGGKQSSEAFGHEVDLGSLHGRVGGQHGDLWLKERNAHHLHPG